MMVWNAPGRLAAIYPVHQTTTARGGFLFRRREELMLDYRDVDGQKQVLHQIYGGDGWQVPRLLAEIDAAEDFYFDSISQIVMDSWNKGRVTLVGDAGYSQARPLAAAPASPWSAPMSWLKNSARPAGTTRQGCAPTRTACASSPPRPATSDAPPCPR